MVETHNRAPGVYRQDVFPAPASPFVTGVPAFLGYSRGGTEVPLRLTLWPQFTREYGAPLARGYLAAAVRGFFENDGLACYVVRLGTGVPLPLALRRGLAALRAIEDVDLVGAPDVMCVGDPTLEPDDPTVGIGDPDPGEVAAMQRDVLDHCAGRNDRFALLDAVPSGLAGQRALLGGGAESGALYHPWVLAPGETGPARFVPPSGHVAGVFSRSDRAVGVHKPPANEVVEGVLDLRANLDEGEVGRLYADGVNCLRAFPGRGVRVWGARTLSRDPVWRYVNVRRVFLTLGRWLERYMAGLVDEPNDVRLWVRIMRDLSAHLDGLHQRGALTGRTPAEAYFVKCDNETNPPEVVDAGRVVTHVGVSLAVPAEVVVVRIIHGAGGVAITTGP